MDVSRIIISKFQQEAKRQGLTRKDLEEAVKEARKERLQREASENAEDSQN